MSTRGFSLIETVIVLAILAVIVAIAAPRFVSASEHSAFPAQHAMFRQIEIALELYHLDWGDWPPNAQAGEMPPALIPYVRGEVFLHEPPVGGMWDWNGLGSTVYTHGDNIAALATVFSTQELLEFDAMFDDGSLATGLYRQDGDWLVRPVYAPTHAND